MDIGNSCLLNFHGQNGNILPNYELRISWVSPQMRLPEAFGIWAGLNNAASAIQCDGCARAHSIFKLVEVMNEKGDASLISQHVELLRIHVGAHYDHAVIR
mmetsp:Transcript_6964/g.11646  ORF Transcript_6964/g.11646 Transcript_6964/m.11646 type:complete len:101 (+) Transcript_6964:72-374(+)